jgi:large subunit ribosomal protein L7/L12
MTMEQIIEAVEKMTVLELNSLVKAIEEKWGVSAAAVAVAKEVPIVPAEKIPGDKFVTGVVFQKDIYTIEFIMLLAISLSGNPYIVDDPKAMIREIRQCAEAGYPFLEEMLRDGSQPDLQSLVRSMVKTLGDK